MLSSLCAARDCGAGSDGGAACDRGETFGGGETSRGDEAGDCRPGTCVASVGESIMRHIRFRKCLLNHPRERPKNRLLSLLRQLLPELVQRDSRVWFLRSLQPEADTLPLQPEADTLRGGSNRLSSDILLLLESSCLETIRPVPSRPINSP